MRSTLASHPLLTPSASRHTLMWRIALQGLGLEELVLQDLGNWFFGVRG